MSALRGLGPLAAFGLFLAWTCGEVQASTATIEEIVVVAKTGSRIGPPGGLRLALGGIRWRNLGSLRRQGHPGPRRLAAHGQRCREQLRQPHAELHRRHRERQSARAGRGVHLGAAERQATGFVGRADRRRFELRGPRGARTFAGGRAGRDSQGRRIGRLRLGCGGRGRQFHHPTRPRRSRPAGRVPHPRRQRQPGRRQPRRRLRRASGRHRYGSARGQLPGPQRPRPRRGGLAASRDQRIRQPWQFHAALVGGDRGRSGMHGQRRFAAEPCRRQHDLPLRLRPADHGRARRGPAARLCATRLGLGPGGTTLGRTRIRTQRRQPRSVAKLPGAQHAVVPARHPLATCSAKTSSFKAVRTASASLRRSTTTSITPCARLSARKGIGRTVAAGACRTCTAQTTPSSIRATSWQRTSRRLSSVSAARIATPARRRRCGPCRAWDRAGTSTRSVRRSPPDRGMRPTTIPDYASSSLATTLAMPSPRWVCSTPTSPAISVASAAAQPGSPSASSGVIRRSPTSTTRSPATTASPS